MASKSDRKEYFKKRNEKRQENVKLAKLTKMKNELQSTIAENSDWYNPDRNPYFNRLSGEEVSKYNLEKKKRFFLQYDIDNYYLREKGDSKKYLRNREKAFNNWYLEKDLFHRIQYFRVFRREYLRRMEIEPNHTAQMFNNCFLPAELNPENKSFRKELLHLLDENKNDPEMKVKIPSEWVEEILEEDSSDSYDSDFKGE